MKGLLAVICLLGASVSAETTENELKIPDYIVPCPKPTLDRCLVERMGKIREHLAIGIPELGVPALEPMKLKQFVAERGARPVQLKITAKDMVIHGVGNFTVNDIKTDLVKDTLFIKAAIPHLFVTTKYEVTGRILLLPLTGSGDAWFDIENVKARIHTQNSHVKRNGRTYLNLDEIKVLWDIGKVQMRLNNLFNGDKLLGETMNRFLNENWREVFSEAKDSFVEPIEQIVYKILNSVFTSVPLNSLIEGAEY